MKEDFNIRFEDLENLNVPSWIIQPFECDISEVNVSLQEELIEIREDLELKILFQTTGYAKFWNNKDIRKKFPKLKNIAEPMFLTFPSSYLVEAGFSHINNILRKTRTRFNTW